ncbi:MAG: succinylglutamate desuccinylase/aspartoacylase family protein [Pseudomonadota bacterium]
MTPSIDLSKPGKQHGFLPLIHSDNRHAHAVIPIPITVICGGAGPTTLVTAGVHGDEFAGILAARQLIADLSPASLVGRVIVMPMLNLPACRAETRVSPLDGANLNRVFGVGAPAGPTAAIAEAVVAIILPEVDFVLDLHSGGTTARYLPSAFLYDQPGASLAKKRAAARAFAMPFTLVVTPPPDAGSLLGAAERQGIPAIACEVSGGATLDRHAVAATRAGMLRVLHHLGHCPAPQDGAARGADTRFVRLAFGAAHAVVAPFSGGVLPLHDPGDIIAAGQPAARLYPMEDQSQTASVLTFPKTGLITSVTARPNVRAGDLIFLTGTPEP